MAYTTEVFIPFDQADPGGILYYGNHFAYAHRAIEMFIEDSGITWEKWFRNKEWGVPLIHAEADYKQMVLPGKRYNIEVEVSKLGNSSITFTSTIKSNEGVHSVMKTTHVFIDIKTKKKIAIPEDIRRFL